ncbi:MULTISPECIES: hypothetical protein [Pseudomonas syringae group]|uniref:hypothetical protein n=1 Tax=Pseudomonas syringae group TaxID=136849 RepID=UPI000E30FF6D|nr:MULTISPECIES: hypothetical protein [Pseudomonas syringae group]
MNNPSWKLFGLSPKTLVATVAFGIALMLLFSIWIGLLAVLIVSGVIQYRKYLKGRPEAGYEVTENGTRQLWNDGPKMFESHKRPKAEVNQPE